VLRVTRLPGASTTAVHCLHLSDGTRLVSRRYAWPGFLQAEPAAPAREVDALRLAFSAALPVPEVVATDLTGNEVGDQVPLVLMTFLPGRAVAAPDLGRLAEVAAAIHAVEPAGFPHDYFPWYQGSKVGPPAMSTWPALWEAAIEVWTGAVPDYRPTFVHRDFHPGNVLWTRGRVTGVVDWANACRGPWGCDIAHCRANLTGLSGLGDADRFLAAYESITGTTYDPYWEVASVLEHGPSDWTAESVAESEPRLARALASMARLPPRRG